MKGADVVAEILRREGTEFLSCYPRNPLIEACAKIDIRPILCRQERVGVGMADGYSRTTFGRRIGVFAAQHGPGIENAFPGVAQAYSENVPLLVLPASGPLSRQYTRPVFNAVENYAHVTKWAAFVGDVRDLPGHLRRAYHLMRTGKPGPVLLEIPNDVFNAEYDGDIDYEPVRAWRSAPDPEAVAAAAKLLAAAERPVVFAGQGVLRAEATAELVALAERLSAPVLTTNPGKSAFPENHPLALGSSVVSAPRALSEFLRDSDLVLAIGSSLTTTSFGPNPPAGKRIVHSTNDAYDINKDHPCEIALIGDAKLTLEALLDALAGAKVHEKGDVAGAVGRIRDEWRSDWQRHLSSNAVPIDPYRVVNDLMESVDRENVIVTHDSGSPREQLHPFWESIVPGSYMGWGKSTQLGHSLGLTMGAKLARPEALCVHVLGDSAIGMVGMDLETAARNRIAILTVVLNNGIMAAERDVLIESDRKYAAMDVGGNYKPLAEALGVTAFRVEDPGDIAPTLREAVAVTESGRPALVECMTAEVQEFSRY